MFVSNNLDSALAFVRARSRAFALLYRAPTSLPKLASHLRARCHRVTFRARQRDQVRAESLTLHFRSRYGNKADKSEINTSFALV